MNQTEFSIQRDGDLVTSENEFYEKMWAQKAKGQIIKHNDPLVAVDELAAKMTTDLTAYVTTGQMSDALLDTLTTGNFDTIVTKDFIASMNLIVGNEITMGPNATIEWLNVLETPTIPTQYTDTLALQAWVDSGYKTYIDQYGVYTGTLRANNLIVGASGEQIPDGLIAGATTWNSAEQNAKAYADIIGQDLQTQIDGSITTWFYGYVPTLVNAPANTWATTEDKNNHLGDLFYDTATGYVRRFALIGTYQWILITDTDVTKALADASRAQDTADGKRRAFVVQPIPPYDIGDLWSQGTSGDLMRCATAKTVGQVYAASDWVLSSKYTDDTTVDALTPRVSAAEALLVVQAGQIILKVSQTSLDATNSNVTTAQTQANLGVTNAGLAKTQADLGVANALTAQTQANLGVTNAGLAQTKANQGVADALTAHNLADTGIANAATANALLTDIADDNKLTPSEKSAILNEWNSIVSEKLLNHNQGLVFVVSETAYQAAYNTLNTYVPPLVASLATTTAIVGTTFRSNFKAYYDARTNFLNAISAKSKTLADAAQTKANQGVTDAATAQARANVGVTNAAAAQTTANTAHTDVVNVTTRVTTAESTITAQAGLINLRATTSSLNTTNSNVTGVTTRMTAAESSLSIQAGQIATKVDVAGVKSTIQQSASDVQIAFNAINAAKVTINASGLTVTGGTITGTNISGGTITGVVISATSDLKVSSNVWMAGTSNGLTFGGVISGRAGACTVKYTQGLLGDGSSHLTITPDSDADFIVRSPLGIELLGPTYLSGTLRAESIYIATSVSEKVIAFDNGYGNVGFYSKASTALGCYDWQSGGGGIFTYDHTTRKFNIGCALVANTTLSVSGTMWANNIISSGIVYTNRLSGNTAGDRINIGDSTCRIDVGSNKFRCFTNVPGTDTGFAGDTGSFSYQIANVAKFVVYAAGNKTGGVIEVDGMNVGLSPVDSPRCLHQDILTDIQVDEEGTTVFLDELFARTMDGYAVFPNNGKIEVSEKTANCFRVTGFTGSVDFNIIGNRRDMTHQYFEQLVGLD